MRFVNPDDRRSIDAELKHIYTAVNKGATLGALETVGGLGDGPKVPGATAATWRPAWDRSIPLLEYAPAARKVLYTTNTIEPLN